MKIEMRLLSKIIPYDKNPRKIPQSAVDLVAKSLKEFSWQQPIVVDKKGVVVVGHTRRLAAMQLKWKEAPVSVFTGTAAQAKAYRLMDNRSNQETDWMPEDLKLELLDLKALDLDLSLTGFNSRELDMLLSPVSEAEYDIPPVPEIPISQRGDLWQMGEHRILCGDSTSAEDVERLCIGHKAGLMNTDPPYGISYDSAELHEHGVSYAKIAGDHHEDEKLQQFLEKAFGAALTVLKSNAAWYMWHAMLTQGFFAAAAAAAAAANVILHRQIIWSKPVLVFGRGQYHWKHELCFMGWVKGNQPPDYSEHKDVTVWEVPGIELKERRAFKHSSPKPVELFRRPILKHLKPDEYCYEPFSGSGPQIIAAELTGRRCLAMEIDPCFVDVAVRRWMNLTGKNAYNQDGVCFPYEPVQKAQAA